MLEQLDYSRQEGAADLDVMRQSTIGIVGTGSFSLSALNFVRMGVGSVWACDHDSVEPRNVTSQGFTWRDAVQRRSKVDAFRDECLAINPDVRIEAIEENFLALPDPQLKALLDKTSLLLMTTDYHPAQARGALAALVCDRPVICASLYRNGRAGEIIFHYPGQTLACYRCITRERFEHVARQQAPATGTANGSLPFAAQSVDAIVGHLAVGIIHKWHGDKENGFAPWIDRLKDRNFIQVRMDPDYRLGDDDLFGRVIGYDEQIFCFDTIWQPGSAELNPRCTDCHGRGATVEGRWREETTEIERLPCGCLAQRGRGCNGDCGHLWGCGH